MITEERISNIERQLRLLQNSFIQSQKNAIPTTDKAYATASKVEEITPWTATKTTYIGDSEVVFPDAPEGNLSVYIKDSEGNYPSYTVERISDRIRVSFEPLENVTEVTISII